MRADGRLAQKEIEVPRRTKVVGLHEIKTFEEIETTLADESGYFRSDGTAASAKGWLVRRLTGDAWEVWTPTHGWLFDGKGHVLNEARPVRGDGTGREWFGAFLPDGRWVTTDLQELDCTLWFFSRDGQRTRQMTSAELAPPGEDGPRRALLGWARSDKDGAAWVVNVGSEAGYATVRVGPEGPARVLGGIERWQLCHPRALGPRGFYLEMSVPDDTGQLVLTRMAPGHGAFVGFPSYRLDAAKEFSLDGSFTDKPSESPVPAGRIDHVTLPDGEDVFGFWPGGQDAFIGTETTGEPGDRDTARTRKSDAGLGFAHDNPSPIVDKTWFFDHQWHLRGWLRARRLADGADGKTLLLRLNDDGRIVTLRPDLHAAEVRHFLWPDASTADAVTLYDDLRLGLFVRGKRLVLAGW